MAEQEQEQQQPRKSQRKRRAPPAFSQQPKRCKGKEIESKENTVHFRLCSTTPLKWTSSLSVSEYVFTMDIAKGRIHKEPPETQLIHQHAKSDNEVPLPWSITY